MKIDLINFHSIIELCKMLGNVKITYFKAMTCISRMVKLCNSIVTIYQSNLGESQAWLEYTPCNKTSKVHRV